MAAGTSALNFALILSRILLRLTPERAPRTVLRYERPENLGFYACLVTTNVGSFNFAIEKLFSSLKVNSIQNGRPITTIQTSTIEMKNTTKYCFILYIMMSGDVHYNPGPIRYPCTKCKQPVKSNQKALQCDFCDHWTHLRCTTIPVKEYHILAKCDDQYFCHLCNDRLPAFSDSFFLNTSVGNNNTVFDETLENTSNTPNSTSV